MNVHVQGGGGYLSTQMGEGGGLSIRDPKLCVSAKGGLSREGGIRLQKELCLISEKGDKTFDRY